ncbi:MAG: glycosyltransferase family 1 protein [Dysgonamonadaceae bacterium]|nr:glycosyltransferase family 1 protein [Dysgonamonadaceae bacterium]
MTDYRLHIVSFNIPYPADYGGVIDVFYKLKALSEAGVKITLHAFEYGRQHATELEKYCKRVIYYPRKTGLASALSRLPYIVNSRRNSDLLKNLMADHAPILFEGLHCCYYLSDRHLKNRIKLVRAHNIEHLYYSGLAKNAASPLKKLYFNSEARKLQKFEEILADADYILTLSTTEQEYFSKNFGKEKTKLIPLFFDNSQFDSKLATAERCFKIQNSKLSVPYVLYQGDLSTPENRMAAEFLIKSAAAEDRSIHWIFAGKNPPKPLTKLAAKYKNVEIQANVSDETMLSLISGAVANILYTSQISGVKIKLLNALYYGGHCIVNPEMVEGSGLGEFCRITSGKPQEFLSEIRTCLDNQMSEDEQIKRREAIGKIYNNESNALKIKEMLK